MPGKILRQNSEQQDDSISCVSSSQVAPTLAYVARGADILQIELSLTGSKLPVATLLRSFGDPLVQPRSILPISPNMLIVGAASSGAHGNVAGSHDRLALLRG
eukprot:SAG31_NODE_31004_length_373_cov_1.244526_1_plen_102_part_10